MASNNQAMIQHFADPHHHPLVQTRYRHGEAGLCNICLLKLAGPSSVTYGCYTCSIHLHSACARYFQETISFFAHPEHALKLRRSPGRLCDICRGDCPQGSFVYSCIGCGFDVHPICSIFPESVSSPFDAGHHLCMLSSESPGSCSACRHPLPRWHYIGGSSVKLHIACAIRDHTVVPAAGSYGDAAAAQQGSRGAVVSQHKYLYGGPVTGPAGYYNNPFIQGYGGHASQVGSYCYYAPPAPIYGIYYGPPAMPSGGGGYGAGGSGQQSILQNPSSLMSAIARFLLRTAIGAVASDLLSELLSGSSDSIPCVCRPCDPIGH